MKKEKQLIKNTVIVAIGKICTQFVSFFLLPLYTAVLSTEEYGIVDLLNTYISLLIPLFFLQMDQAIFRHLIDVREDENKKTKLITTTLLTVCVQAFLFIVLYIAVGQFIKNEYKYFLATNVIASMFANIMLQISRGLGDNATYSQGSLVSGAGTVILNVIFICVFKLGASGMLLANLIANIMCSLFVFFKIKIYKYISTKSYSKKALKQLWKYSIPLVPNQLSWWIINVSDRTIVTYCLGIAINGVYSAANKFSSMCIAIFGIFNMTWSESASMYINEEGSDKYFSNVINMAVRFFSSACLGVIAVMPFVFKYLITGAGYAEAYYQIPILMIATIFNIMVSLFGSIYVALKKSGEIAKTSIYSAIINIGINLLLIKSIKLYAASISTLLAYAVMACYRYCDVQKYVKIKLDYKYILGFIFISIPIIVFYYFRNVIVNIFGLTIVVIFAFIANKKMLVNAVLLIKKKFNLKNKNVTC